MMVDEADVVNEAVAGGPSRKRRDSRSPPASPRDKRRRADLNPNAGKRANPPTPPISPLENINHPLPPVSQPVAHLPQPPGISDKPAIHTMPLNHNVKVPVPGKKRKLPEGEGWNEQRKQAKQSVNSQLRKLQQLHHNKQHSQVNSAFTTPGNTAKDKLESSKDISSILRNACMVPNTSNTKLSTNKVDNKKTNHGLHNDSSSSKNDKVGSRKKEVLKSKALRKIYEENTKLRQMICKQIRTLGQGKYLVSSRKGTLHYVNNLTKYKAIKLRLSLTIVQCERQRNDRNINFEVLSKFKGRKPCRNTNIAFIHSYTKFLIS